MKGNTGRKGIVVFSFILAAGLLFLWAGPASAIQVYPLKQSYRINEPISVTFKNIPATRSDWITIVPVGSAPDYYIESQYTDGRRSGSLTFQGMTAPGDYEVRLFLNWPAGGYNIAARKRFRIYGGTPQYDTSSKIKLVPIQQIYAIGQGIRVRYYGMPGTGGDWLTIVRAGAPADDPGEWVYLKKNQFTGEATFKGMYAPGKYEVRAYLNWPKGGYNIAARKVFYVK